MQQDVTLILLASGNSTRFNLPVKKQWLQIAKKPLWQFVADSFNSVTKFTHTIIVMNENEIKLAKRIAPEYSYVVGSKSSRQNSVANALKEVNTPFVLISDVARACIEKELILELLKNKKSNFCIAPAIKVSDTCYFDAKPIDREKLLRIQTPQLCDTNTLKKAHALGEFSDESSAFYAFNKNVLFVQGSNKAHKLTYKEDLALLSCLRGPVIEQRSGIGIDIHPFDANKKMYLCGVEIKSDIGFKAHSDGDVAIHALIDALLGAAALGDIGEFFPDNDKKYKNIDSKELLKEIVTLITQIGYEIVNIDLSIIAQFPKITPYKEEMIQTLASLLHIPSSKINIKATTAEKLGFIGRKEGVLVQAIANLKTYKWDEA